MGNLTTGFRKFLQNKNTVTVVGIVLGILIIYVAYTMRIKAEINPITVPFAAEQIKAGTQITESMISTRQVPPSMLEGEVITNIGEIIDKFAAADVPAIGVTCTNPQVTLGNNHYFRICFLDPFQGSVHANLAKDKFGAKKAYALAKLGDDYSVGLCNYFIEGCKKLGIEVIFETFPDGTSDFAAYVANAKNNKADVFFSPVSIEAAALIIEQANTQGLKIPLLAGDTWDSNVVLAAAKGTNIDVYVTTFFVEGSADANVVSFVDGFRNYLNTNATAKTNNGGDDEIAAVSAMGFDAYYTALEALKAAGSTKSADVMKALPSVTYNGVSGSIAFDKNGDAERDVAYIKKVNNSTGKWDFIAIQKVN